MIVIGKNMSIDKITPEQWDEANRNIDSLGPEIDMDLEEKCDFQGESDPVNHPPHYNKGGIECIDYIKQQLGSVGIRSYLEGNVVKYIHRHKYKDQNIRDLEKAKWYLDRLIFEYKNM